MSDKSVAHKHDMNLYGQGLWPDGLAPWEKRGDDHHHCEYCGSLHPEEVAKAIRAGAVGEWADWKYGWPHKVYFHGAISGKFYTVHLQDATAEDRETIEKHLGLRFTFPDDGRKVGWAPYNDAGNSKQGEDSDA